MQKEDFDNLPVLLHPSYNLKKYLVIITDHYMLFFMYRVIRIQKSISVSDIEGEVRRHCNWTCVTILQGYP